MYMEFKNLLLACWWRSLFVPTHVFSTVGPWTKDLRNDINIPILYLKLTNIASLQRQHGQTSLQWPPSTIYRPL